jgi:hypothetical protein
MIRAEVPPTLRLTQSASTSPAPILIATLLLAACTRSGQGDGGSLDGGDAGLDGGPALGPTVPQLLTPPDAGTKDEDPGLLRARDGSYFLAWLSDRDGNDEIYVMRSLDARTWSAPVRITYNSDADWYPHLAQTADGRFHLVWFRTQVNPPYYRHVYASSSNDGLSWDAGSERLVTDAGLSDDWAPMVVATSDGRLLAYFSSQLKGTTGNSELFVSQSFDLGETWAPPQHLNASDPARVDVFPYVVERHPGDFLMVWETYDVDGGTNYFDPSSDLAYATSADGITWSAATALTHDDAGYVDAIPSVYDRRYVLWTSTGPIGPPTPKILDLNLEDGGLVDSTAAHGMNGYSAQAVASDEGGLYLGVWVSDIGSKRLFWQLFAR